MKSSRIKFISIGVIIFLLLALVLYYFYQQNKIRNISNFKQCKDSGYTVIETSGGSFECRLPDDRIFVGYDYPAGNL